MKIRDRLRQNIRDFREDKNLTQADIAEKLGMSVTGYAKLERGESQIRVERLEQIAQILDVEPNELMCADTNGVIVFNNSNDNFSNSTHFSLALGDPALQLEIDHLRYIIDAKNDLLNARDAEIEALKQQIETLNKVVAMLEK